MPSNRPRQQSAGTAGLTAVLLLVYSISLCAQPQPTTTTGYDQPSPASSPATALSLLASGNQYNCAWSMAQGLRCWGQANHAHPPQPPRGEVLQALALGDRHGCYAYDATVTCWGLDWRQPLPPDPGQSPPPPRHYTLPETVDQLALGAYHSCALGRSGQVYCWGANDFGQSGRLPANHPTVLSPRPLTLDSPIQSITAGLLHSCALGQDHKVRCWGNGSEGQLGNGQRDSDAQPQLVHGLTDIVGISAGLYHNCARDRQGNVWCWGNNKFGQLGNGTTQASPQPVPVSLAAAAQQLNSGGYFSCAGLSNQQRQCWGWNAQDQLGVISAPTQSGAHGFKMSQKPLPTKLPATYHRITSGWGHSCAAAVAQLYCWGRNDSGQLGNGASASSAQPVQVTHFELQSIPQQPARAKHLQQPGLDVSYHSGPVDWQTLKDANYGFAFVLTTAGVDFRDPMVDAHWAELKLAGFSRGAYHFFVAHDDPAQQAHWFIRNAPLEPGDLAPVVDIETLGSPAPKDLKQRLHTFLKILENHYGIAPIVYTGPVFWNKYGSQEFGDYPLWVAEYDTPQPTLPQGWSNWSIWQWQGNKPLPGVANADLNRIGDHVTLTQLRIPPPTN